MRQRFVGASKKIVACDLRSRDLRRTPHHHLPPFLFVLSLKVFLNPEKCHGGLAVVSTGFEDLVSASVWISTIGIRRRAAFFDTVCGASRHSNVATFKLCGRISEIKHVRAVLRYHLVQGHPSSSGWTPPRSPSAIMPSGRACGLIWGCPFPSLCCSFCSSSKWTLAGMQPTTPWSPHWNFKTFSTWPIIPSTSKFRIAIAMV